MNGRREEFASTRADVDECLVVTQPGQSNQSFVGAPRLGTSGLRPFRAAGTNVKEVLLVISLSGDDWGRERVLTAAAIVDHGFLAQTHEKRVPSPFVASMTRPASRRTPHT